MEQKKKEKDVLIVRDEKTGEISVVAGLDKDGNPKRTPAKADTAQDFLQFDRHGDVLDNFFKNFVRQCKEPSRFGFYRVAADQVEHLIGVMKELLKNPEANKELLAPHKVDISEYENKVKAEQAKSVEPQNKEEMKNRSKPRQMASVRATSPLTRVRSIGNSWKSVGASAVTIWRSQATWRRCSTTASPTW